MSKAEERALEAYPGNAEEYYEIAIARNFFKKGYEQAEKDMMEQAVDATVHLEPGVFPVVEIGVGRFGLKVRDKVKLIIIKDDGKVN